MPRPHLFPLILLCSLSLSAQSSPKKEKYDFPSEDDIKLLLVQADRAFSNYEQAVNAELATLGKNSGAEKDREVLIAARDLIPRLQKSPQGFNGPAGFLLITSLDDASRNMAVCMSQGMTQVSTGLAVGLKPSDLERQMGLAQNCVNVSTLLYTVSENAVNLYDKYLLANYDLQQRQQDAIEQCMKAIKAQCTPKSKAGIK